MADKQVEVVRTLVSAAIFSRAVIDAWWGVRGGGEDDAPKGAVALLYAHYMLETGGLNCYGWNIGNVKYTIGCGYDYHCLHGVWEGVSAGEAKRLVSSGEAAIDSNLSHQQSCAPNISVVFNPPHPATRFRAFPDLEDAMDDHLVMLCKKRYASAWPSVLSGDVMTFAQALKARGYMTASAKSYGDGMTPPFKHFMASQEYEAALAGSKRDSALASGKQDVTEPVYEFSGGIIHPQVEFEPYNSDE